MITRKTGKKLIKVMGFLAILISIAAIGAVIVESSWVLLLNVLKILTHISLFVIGVYSRKLDEFNFKTFFGIGIFAVICTSIEFFRSIVSLLLFPSFTDLFYTLSFPVCILFGLGVTIYERGQKSEYDD